MEPMYKDPQQPKPPQPVEEEKKEPGAAEKAFTNIKVARFLTIFADFHRVLYCFRPISYAFHRFGSLRMVPSRAIAR